MTDKTSSYRPVTNFHPAGFLSP